ncbi:alpha/beta fold hydrolase [Polynucleobacter necessarius]|uniref:alpha/beta fold hydrolase n=1 Tax=Polynucleobacter necessarius TaxID=576610 RepID=UPI0013B05C50|nr:hypothetical protein [Polynucleobacter necessarius]
MKKIFLKYCLAALLILLLGFSWSAELALSACNIEVKTAPVGGGTIEYLQAGNGAPILLLHGLFAQKEQWSELACQLSAAGYRDCS